MDIYDKNCFDLIWVDFFPYLTYEDLILKIILMPLLILTTSYIIGELLVDVLEVIIKTILQKISGQPPAQFSPKKNSGGSPD